MFRYIMCGMGGVSSTVCALRSRGKSGCERDGALLYQVVEGSHACTEGCHIQQKVAGVQLG
jgi:hypothetical protein